MLRLDPGFGGLSADSGLSAAVASGNGADRSFSTLYRELSSEIHDFIENGSTNGEPPAMNAEGYAQRARLEGGEATGPDGEVAAAFLDAVSPLAQATGKRLGVSPDIIAAQAALESGWGQRPLRHADGSDSHNLFGIKAGGGWSGDSTQAATTEYENGVAVSKSDRFRAYSSDAAAFQDFTKLLLNAPRYQGALNTGNDVRAYAQGLMRGGYATDPAYGEKLARVVSRLHSKD